MAFLAAYLTAFVAMCALDGVWLSLTFNAIYEPVLGPIKADHANYLAAAMFYLFYPIGVVYFATLPALRAQDLQSSIVKGALFGLFAYATYDLVNYALLRGWSFRVTVADIAWGTLATATAAALSFVVASWALNRLPLSEGHQEARSPR